jgi:hypothetical protein
LAIDRGRALLVAEILTTTSPSCPPIVSRRDLGKKSRMCPSERLAATSLATTSPAHRTLRTRE